MERLDAEKSKYDRVYINGVEIHFRFIPHVMSNIPGNADKNTSQIWYEVIFTALNHLRFMSSYHSTELEF